MASASKNSWIQFRALTEERKKNGHPSTGHVSAITGCLYHLQEPIREKSGAFLLRKIFQQITRSDPVRNQSYQELVDNILLGCCSKLWAVESVLGSTLDSALYFEQLYLSFQSLRFLILHKGGIIIIT